THRVPHSFPTRRSSDLDGRRFVFSSTRDGGDIDIFVMNADGTDVTQLTHNDFIADDDPVWSPDGKQIAFHSTREGGDEDIFVMNADGTGVIQLTYTSVLPDGSPVFDAVPAWTAGTRNEARGPRSEEHTSELQSRFDLVCRLLLEKKKILPLLS